MPIQTPPPPAPAGSPPQNQPAMHWRFGLREMLIGTTGFVVFCGIVAIFPLFLTQMLVGTLWIAAGGWLATGLVFARDDQQAFCLGAAIVYTSTWSGIGARFLESFTQFFSLVIPGLTIGTNVAIWADMAILAGAAYVNGLFCIRCRRRFATAERAR